MKFFRSLSAQLGFLQIAAIACAAMFNANSTADAQSTSVATIINFEDAGQDNKPISTQYWNSHGVRFSAIAGSKKSNAKAETLVAEQTGHYSSDQIRGFVGRTGVDVGVSSAKSSLGKFFLSTITPLNRRGGYLKMTIDYKEVVKGASGEIWDIDGAHNKTEQYRVTAYDASGKTIGVINSPIGTKYGGDSLDGLPWSWSFSADIKRIEVEFVGSKTSGAGLAFDNFRHNAPNDDADDQVNSDTYFVRTSGDDKNDGTTKAKAFRTIAKAASVVKAGGTVHVGAGSYRDQLRTFNEGTAQKPIRFVADTQGTRTGDSGTVTITTRVELESRKHLEFVGFRFINGGVATKNSTGLVFDQCDFYNNRLGLEIGSGTIRISRSVIRESQQEGIQIQGGTIELSNCLITRNGKHGIRLNSSRPNVTFRHNTIVHNGGDGISSPAGSATVTNCILAFNRGHGMEGNPSRVQHGDNLIFGNDSGDFHRLSNASTEIFSDPQFRNAAANDFRLTDGSPAIDKGTGSEAIDLSGTNRPVGAGRDIGCFEGGKPDGGDDNSSEYFVRRSGNDRNNGRSPQKAFRTIRKAAKVATAGSTVHVGAGSYTDIVEAKIDGTSDKPIRFLADISGKKTGDRGKVHQSGTWYVNGADHVQIEGFEFGNSRSNGIEWQSSRNGLLKNCRVGSRAFKTSQVRGLRAYASSLTVEGCVFDENNGGVRVEAATTIRVAGSKFTNNKYYGMSLQGGCVAIVEDSVFSGNNDAGLWSDYDRRGRAPNKLTVRRCLLDSNGYGGRIYNTNGEFDTCLISNNSRDGFILSGTAPNFAHCTIVANGGSAIEGSRSAFSINNSIVAKNSRYGIRGSRSTRHSHNIVSGNRGGNFVGFNATNTESTDDPRFVSRSDFHLADGSPAIDRASSSAAAGPDLDGKKRSVGKAPDLGCYENGKGGDDDGDDDNGPNLYVRRSGSDRNSGRSPKKAFRTIGKALAVVKPGEVVFVGAGTYQEQLSRTKLLGTKQKPIRFVADLQGKATGDAGRVVTNNLQLLNSAEVAWVGFNFQDRGNYAVRSVGSTSLSFASCTFSAKTANATIQDGTASFTNCNFGAAANGIIASPTSNVVVKDCSFSSAATGITADRATLSVTSSSFIRSTVTAVQTANSNVSITNVKATQGKIGFNFVGGTASVSNCTLTNMSTAGMYLQKGRGSVANTTVQDSASGYMLTGVQRRGDIEVSGLKLKNISGTGLHLERVTGDFSGDGSQIAAGQVNGVYMSDCQVALTNGSIRGTTIGVNLVDSNVTLERLTLSDLRSGGINATATAAKLADVTISRVGNGRGNGINFSNLSRSTLAGCTISGCATAIQLTTNDTAALANCDLSNNATGLSASSGKVTLTDSTINNTTKYAVSVSNSRSVTLRNVSMKKGASGVYMTRSVSTVDNVSLSEFGKSGWAFSQQGSGTIKDLTIDSSGKGLHLVGDNRDGAFVLTNAKVKNISGAGLQLTNVDGTINSEGTFLAQGQSNGLVLTNCRLAISDAVVRDANIGVNAKGGTLQLVNLAVQNASNMGVHSIDTAVTLRGCAFANDAIAVYGVGGALDVSDTMIDDSSKYGIQLSNNPNVKLTNVSIRNGGAGASMTNSTSTIENVTVTGTSSSAWAFHQSGKGTIKNLTLEDTNTGLSLIGDGALGAFKVSGVRVKDVAGPGLKLTGVDGSITADGTQLAGGGSYGADLSKCRLTLSNAKIRKSNVGLRSQASLVALKNLDVSGTTTTAMGIRQSTATLDKVHVNAGQRIGIYFDASKPTLTNCSVTGGSLGIYSVRSGTTKLSKCKLAGASFGMYLYETDADVSETTISNTKLYGIFGYRAARAKLNRVTIDKGAQGVHLSSCGSEIENLAVSGMSSWAFLQSGTGSLKSTLIRDSQYGISLAGVSKLGDFTISGVKLRNIANQGIRFAYVDGNVTGEGSQIAGGGSYGAYFNSSRVSLTNGTVQNAAAYGVYTRDSNITLSNINIANSGAYGIYSYRSDLSLDKSVVKNTKSWAIVQSTGSMKVSNSVVANNGYGIYAYSPTNSMIVNATVVNNRYGIYKYGGTLDVYNNIVSSTSGLYGLLNFSGSMNHTHNLVSGFSTPFYNTTRHDSEVIGTPRFLDAANGSYQHSKGSPAINSGRDVSQWVSTDADGVARPQNKVFDIGAHEYKGTDGGFRILKWDENQ